MNTTRSFDFIDSLVNTQKQANGNAPNATPHYLNLSITDADVFTSGLPLLSEIKVNPSVQIMTHIAIGTDSTPLNIAQTGLIAEHSRFEVDLFSAQIPIVGGQPITQLYQSLFPTNMPVILTPAKDCWINIQEIGLFGDSGALLFSRQLLSYDNRPVVSGGPGTPCSLMIGFLVSWVPNFNLNIFVSSGGTCIQSAYAPFAWGQPVVLTAVPDVGHSFVKFTINSVDYTSNPLTVLMLGDMNVNVVFS